MWKLAQCAWEVKPFVEGSLKDEKSNEILTTNLDKKPLNCYILFRVEVR